MPNIHTIEQAAQTEFAVRAGQYFKANPDKELFTDSGLTAGCLVALLYDTDTLCVLRLGIPSNGLSTSSTIH